MASKCVVCGDEINNGNGARSFRGKDVSELVPCVCTWDCLARFIDEKQYRPVEHVVVRANKNIRPFASDLEQRVYTALTSRGLTLLYEPCIITHKLTHTHYVPDFLVAENRVFIEVKGVSNRISKVRLFKECIPLIMLTTPMIRFWEDKDGFTEVE